MTTPSADDLLPADFDHFVLSCLADAPRGIDEFSLLKALSTQFPETLFGVPGALRDPLLLFQTHFLLFHALYRLSDRLADQQLGMQIHALSIRMLPRDRPNVSGAEMAELDPLRSYYLDWQQWLTTQGEDVERLLKGFRQGNFAVSSEEVDAALQSFGLQEPIDPRRIKQRYRELMSQHHPDRGGNTERVQEVNQALLILQRYYGKP
ncbi:MAG: molecular chaperone DnaJ [Pseudomonas sp.]|nr:molecular chaperone DnaJ [Pseudomonas sp.]